MLRSCSRTFPKANRRRTRRLSGFSLLEVMIGLSLFVIAGLGVMEVIGLINQSATVSRAMTAARMLVQAKISKAQTDVYTPSNGVVPLSCSAPTSGTYANEDSTTADPFDSSANADKKDSTKNWSQDHLLTLVDNPNDPTASVLGTMTQTVSTFEASSKTLLVTFTITFTYRGKSYSVTQSTVRAPDQL